jgi:hypothetical protein
VECSTRTFGCRQPRQDEEGNTFEMTDLLKFEDRVTALEENVNVLLVAYVAFLK